LTLGSLEAALVNNHQNNLRRGGGVPGIQPAELVIGFELVGFQKLSVIEAQHQRKGQKADGDPHQTFSFAAGKKQETQVWSLRLYRV
jgi:hypothetical protein